MNMMAIGMGLSRLWWGNCFTGCIFSLARTYDTWHVKDFTSCSVLCFYRLEDSKPSSVNIVNSVSVPGLKTSK